jgi:Flp pilus assembly pilin Flp
MLQLFTYLKAVLATRDRGASAAEYALLLALIAAAIAVTVGLFGTAIVNIFQDTCTEIGETC